MDFSNFGPLADLAIDHIRTGRFERSLAFVTGAASLASTVEVAQEHYTGSYGNPVMYSPVACCVILAAAGFWGALDPWAARVVLPWASALLIAVSLTGFGFHLRGIARKPGGWTRNLVFNIVMGPPVFAPLVLSMNGLLGLAAARLAPENAVEALPADMLATLSKGFAIATILFALLNGFEALYSHYKSRFANAAQWTPIVLAPLLAVGGAAFLLAPDSCRSALLVVSLIAMVAGVIGMGFHARGVLRRPGGLRHGVYNFIYGPPLFAPLLFSATGMLGLLAALIGNPS